MQDKPANWIEE